MYLELVDIINEYEKKEYDESILKEPLTDDEIDKFVNNSKLILQFVPSDEYLNLLKITNGFDWDGIFFYNAEDFIGQNIEQQKIEDEQKKFILFGNSGNVDQYTYNTVDKTYNVSRMFSLQESSESFNTFDELFSSVFRESINELINDA